MRTETVPQDLWQLSVNTIKFLSIDQVEAAKSGHPGMPMGCAEIALTLFAGFLRYNPADPGWGGRDRFVLSAGHGSALLYSMLHLAGYDLPMAELRRFRQWGSHTPGHPEHGWTPGVETTTGPLGQGFANGVGMALGAKILQERFKVNGFNPYDYKIYGIVSDGDLMEGISQEAGSIAGHLALDNLIYIYDSNQISIEGKTEITFTEDTSRRFEALGWAVCGVDGRNRLEIAAALDWAQNAGKPVLIIARTHIGDGSPGKMDSSDCHGAPLGPAEAAATRKNLQWAYEPFYVPTEVYELFTRRRAEIEPEYLQWNQLLQSKILSDETKREEWTGFFEHKSPDDLEARFLAAVKGIDKLATRAASGKVLQVAADLMPALLGGSADLAPSNNTTLTKYGHIDTGKFGGRNLHFGVREHAMGAICNGLALSGFVPYGATFLVFSDYMRTPIRLSALMRIGVVWVFTHDSFWLGEDGPTHQPVEHLASLRDIPALRVMRPADARETALCWAIALRYREGPTAMLLSRQNLPTLDETKFPNVLCSKGAYVLIEPAKRDVTILASGSEVSLALAAADELAKVGVTTAVASMPCMEIFLEQEASYREKVLGEAPRVVIEAAFPYGLRLLAPNGLLITRDTFGESAPAEVLAEKFGFTPAAVVRKVLDFLGK
ncbi:MAG: transketolase [Candidatus Brocadiia bacterium]